MPIVFTFLWLRTCDLMLSKNSVSIVCAKICNSINESVQPIQEVVDMYM